jgi:hypothetical protein
MSEKLSARDRKRLERLEAKVESGLDSVWEMAVALQEIHQGRLYRESHKSFAEYFAARWGGEGGPKSRARAYQLIHWAAMSTYVGASLTELQARDLAGLTPAELAAYAQARADLEHAAALEQAQAVNAGEQRGRNLGHEIGRGDVVGAIRRHLDRIGQHLTKCGKQHAKLPDVADPADTALASVRNALEQYLLTIESTTEQRQAA